MYTTSLCTVKGICIARGNLKPSCLLLTIPMGAPPISASEGSEGTTIDATIDAAGETTTRQQQLLHDSGLDLEWSSSEQSTLNEGLER